LSGKLDTINAALEKVKAYLAEHSFKDTAEEIAFFKDDKPLFVSEQLLAQEMYDIETKTPLTGEADIRAFYETELKFIEHYLDKHQFLYQYYLLEATEMDNLLFVRGADTPTVLLPEVPDLDPAFSTKGDYLFAKFIAYEKLRKYLMDELFGTRKNERPFTSKKGRQLEWTGDKSNLVELAYAIYDTRQINNGDVDISDIVDWLEQSLHVNLGRYYRRFTEIKMRKNVSRTRYLDHMRDMFLKHIEEGEAFKPAAPKPVSGSKAK